MLVWQAQSQLGALIVRTPNLLHRPLSSIRERVAWLRESGVVPQAALAAEEAIAPFLLRFPDYFSTPPAECANRLAWLKVRLQPSRPLNPLPVALGLPPSRPSNPLPVALGLPPSRPSNTLGQ